MMTDTHCSSRRFRNVLSALLVLLTLAACDGNGSSNNNGGGGGGPAGFVGNPPAPQNGAPAGIVNAANAGNARFEVTVGQEFGSGFNVFLILTDSLGSSMTFEQPAPASGGLVAFENVNLTNFNEGQLNVMFELRGASGAAAASSGFTITLDTMPPVAPTGLFVNSEVISQDPIQAIPANTINSGNAQSTPLRIVFPQGTNSDDKIRVFAEAGQQVLELDAITPPDTSGASDFNADLSLLPDGPVSLTTLITDGAGNETLFTGTAANKDVFVAAPTTPSIPTGTTNPAEVVNASTALGADFTSGFSSASIAGDRVFLMISDGSNSITTPLVDFSSPGAPISISNVELFTLNDGPLSYTAYALDMSGNRSPSIEVTGRKDTVIGLPSGAPITGASNINANNVMALSFDVFVDSNTASGDQVQVRLDDGSNPVVVIQGTLSGGAGTELVGPGDASSLNDGFISLRVRFSDSAGNSNEIGLGTIAKDATPPGTPQSVSITSGSLNPINVINAATISNATVTAQAFGGNEPSRTITVVVSDGVQSLTLTNPATNAGEVVTWTNQDFSGFSDGPISLTATHEDSFGNASTATTQSAVIDRVAASPTMVAIPSGANNPSNTITAGNEGSVTFNFTFPSSAMGTDVVVGTLSDGSNSVSIPNQNAPNGGGVLVVSSIDASTLSDGTVNISGVVTDAAGNSSAFGPLSFTKSTTPATLPSSIRIAAGTSNPSDVINVSSVAAVDLEVSWDSSMVGNETANFTLSDGIGGMVNVGPITPPSGGGTAMVGPFSTAGLADGPIAIALSLTNPSTAISNGSGMTALKDTVLPAASTNANVDSGTSNPQDIINASSENAVSVTAGFGSAARSDEQARVVLTDTSNMSVTSAYMNTAMGGGPVTWSNLNCSALADGNITVTVEILDIAQNLRSTAGNVAVKDTQAGAATTARVAMTSNNPQDFINNASAALVSVSVVIPGSYVGNESVVIEVRDSSTGLVTSSAQTAPAGGTMTFSSLDCSGLIDGLITIDAIVTDAAANTVTHNGITAMKDVVLPTAPTALAIPAGGSNNSNQINVATVSSVATTLIWDASMGGDETAVITITDSASGTAMANVTTIASGGGSATLTGINASALADGPITLSGVLSDPAGNTASFTGLAATKDATAPAMPTSLGVIVGGNNPANYINIATVSAPVIDAVFTAGSATTDLMDLVLSDTSSTVTYSNVSGVNMSGTVQFTGMSAAALNDGPITLALTIIDDHGNSVNVTGTQAIKDVSVPVAPNYIRIAATANNPQSFVNNTTNTAAQIDVDLPSGQGYTTGDSLVVTVTDSLSGTAMSSSVTAGNDGGVASATVNCSALADGSLSLDVDITDAAGNSASYSGTAGELDTVDPTGPTGVGVAMSASNAQHFINSQNAGSAMMDVIWAGSAAVTDSATFTFTSSGGGTPITSSGFNPAGSGAEVVGPINLTSLSDGTITVSGSYSDQAGNAVAFSGTNATKATTLPVAPTAASVLSGGSNAADIINLASLATVMVQVSFDGTSTAGNTVEAILQDSAMGQATTATQTTTGGPEVMTFSIDATSIIDGAIAVIVEVTDTNMSLASLTGTPASKDTILPAAPSSSGVVMTMNNAAGFINDASKAAVSVEIVLDDSGYLGGEMASITLSDTSVGTVTAGPVARPMGNATVAFTGIDCTGLVDGVITLSIDLVDNAGNPRTVAGTASAKDVVAPTAPTVTRVAAGVTNAIDFVNNQTEGAVILDVTWDVSMDGTETATVVFTDGSAGTATSPTYTVPASGGADTMPGGSVAALADGSLGIAMTLSDPAGNSTPFAGMSATKNTVAPDPATAANVDAGGGNVQDVVNVSNVANFSVTATFPGTSVVTNDIRLRLIDSAMAEVATSLVPSPGGAGNHQWTGLDTSTLMDGVLQIVVEVQNPNGNLASFSGGTVYTGGTGALQDSVAPDLVASSVLNSLTNAEDVINSTNVAAATVRMAWGSTTDANDTFSITVSDGFNTDVTASGNAPASTGNVDETGLDLSGLNDGFVTLTVVASDAAGNTTTTSNMTIAKLATFDVTRYAYVANEQEGTIGTYLATPDGVLHSQGFVLAGSGPVSVATDYMSRWLYAANSTSNSISAYTIESKTGRLTSIGDIASGTEPKNVTVDSFGRFVYTTNGIASSISVFTVNSGTGALTAGTAFTTTTTPRDFVVHPNGQWAYVATDGGYNALSIHQTTGVLTQINAATHTQSLQAVAIHPSGNWLYAATNGDQVLQASIDSTGAVTLGTTVATSTAPHSIAASPSGKWVIVGSLGGDDLQIYAVNSTTGALTATGAAVSTGGNPIGVAFNHAGDLVYASSATNDTMSVYDFNDSTGALTLKSINVAQDSPQGIAVSGGMDPATFDLLFVPVVNTDSSTIAVHSVNNTSGALTPVGSAVSTGSMSSPTALEIHPSNQWLYALNQDDNEIAVFSFNASTGVVADLSLDISTGGTLPSDIVLDPSGRFLFVSNFSSDNVQAFSINQSTGALTAIGSPLSVGGSSRGPAALSVDPKGQVLYIANQTHDSLSTFSINKTTGALSGVATSQGLNTGTAPTDIYVHPTGQWVYVVCTGSGTLETYSVNTDTGFLTYDNTVAQASQPWAIVVNPAGTFAYVTSQGSGETQAYTVSSTDGSLTAVGMPIASGAEPLSLAISPRSDFLYVGDYNGGLTGLLSVFSINPTTGALTAASTQSVSGMGTANILLISGIE